MKTKKLNDYDENLPLGALTIKQFKELMLDIQNQITFPPAAPEEELLKLKEVMALLKVGRSTVFSWKKQNIIKSRTISGTLYFKKSDIIKLINANS